MQFGDVYPILQLPIKANILRQDSLFYFQLNMNGSNDFQST